MLNADEPARIFFLPLLIRGRCAEMIRFAQRAAREVRWLAGNAENNL